MLCVSVLYCVVNNNAFINKQKTSSVTAGFGRHSMPPPASNPYLWPFDLETGMGVASKVGTFLPDLGTLDLWVLELFAMYATDGQTERQTDGQTDVQTDGQKQRLLPPSMWSGA